MVDSLPMEVQTKKPKAIVQRSPIEVFYLVVSLVVPPIVPATATIVVVVHDGLRQEMRQLVDLMKNIKLDLLNSVGNGHCRERQWNQPTNGC